MPSSAPKEAPQNPL